MDRPLDIQIDRSGRLNLSRQIYEGIAAAIAQGHLTGGARLPSWSDLASQLGVARGTVRAAYDRLADNDLILCRGAAGTWVNDRTPAPDRPAPAVQSIRQIGLAAPYGAAPLAFQVGLPAEDAFPLKTWSRMLTRGARAAARMPVAYPDPSGAPELRRSIASYLILGRGMDCDASQIFVTGGYAASLSLIIQTMGLAGSTAWMEEPGFPIAREALRAWGIAPRPIPVDHDGLQVDEGIASAPDARFCIVTPSHHAPLGAVLSPSRRADLLGWAGRSDTWVIEDDYLGDLQLGGRAPALAAIDGDGRVLHIGSFSKTLSPALRLGFVAVPKPLVPLFEATTSNLAPMGGLAEQLAVAMFMDEGFYMRHLRKMRQHYRARHQSLLSRLHDRGLTLNAAMQNGGLAVIVELDKHVDDIALAAAARKTDMAPVPLSIWYGSSDPKRGLLLGATNFEERRGAADCDRIAQLIDSQSLS